MSFSSSTQWKYWTFSHLEEIAKKRENTNKKYVLEHSKSAQGDNEYLTPEEEFKIVKYYELKLKRFTHDFRPRQQILPREVRGIAHHLYKRFFVATSVMEYHPDDILYTCVFVACKLAEYQVPLDLFVNSLNGNPRVLKSIILDQELEILHRIGFYLNVHTPYRAVEGMMIFIRTKSPLERPDRLYDQIYRWLSSMWFTDACLLFPPVHISLAAILHSVSRAHQNLDDFVITQLLDNPPIEVVNRIIKQVREIRAIVRDVVFPTEEGIPELEQKLARCRNPRNNPSNEIVRMLEYALEDSAVKH